jgi:hypothetical protein
VRSKQTYANKTVPRLELLVRSLVVVDQSEARCPSTTKLCPKTEYDNTGLVSLVDTSELLGEIRLRDVGAPRVEDLYDKLAAGEEPIGEELAGANGYWC